MSDRLILHGLRYRANIGSTAEERAYPQPIVVDVELSIDIRPAARTGDLAATVCWSSVRTCIESVIGSRPWTLVEELVHAIGRAITERAPSVDAVRITVKKFPFPNAEWVGITIDRARDEFAAGGD